MHDGPTQLLSHTAAPPHTSSQPSVQLVTRHSALPVQCT